MGATAAPDPAPAPQPAPETSQLDDEPQTQVLPPTGRAQRLGVRRRDAVARVRGSLGSAGPDAAGHLVVAAVTAIGIVVTSLVVQGGSSLSSLTVFEMAALVLGLGVALAVALQAIDRPLYGPWAVLAFAGFFLFTALSVLWSVKPDASWNEANRTLAYLALFVAGVGAARIGPKYWLGLLYGLVVGLGVVAVAAVTTKIFPGAFAETDTFARLRAPFGYWNAAGLLGALGVPLALWLGARREARFVEQVVAAPLATLFGAVIMLSYSRGSLLACLAAVALWLWLVPLRLRTLVLLGIGALGAAAITVVAFTNDSLSTDGIELASRISAGRVLGLVVVGALAASAAAAAGIWHLRARRDLVGNRREQIGGALATAAGGIAVIGLVAVLATGGGPGARADSFWEQLTSPEVTTPANSPDRFTSASSIRGSYWRDGFQIFQQHEAIGAGAGSFDTARLRFRDADVRARHAHGWVPQTMAELGLLGLEISLLVLVAWALAARRPLASLRRSQAPTRELVGVGAIGAVVVAFGIHSTLDWTWYIPGLAGPALVLAGWLAGRGPVGHESPRAKARTAWPAGFLGRRPSVRRIATVTGLTLVAVAGVWSVIQPYRAERQLDEAAVLFDQGSGSAGQTREALAAARDTNPLSIEPLIDLAVLEQREGNVEAAEKALEEAVKEQPANAEAWLTLGRFRLNVQRDPKEAEAALSAAVFLDPKGRATRNFYIEAVRALSIVRGPADSPTP
ncbi:MAG: tetratricopeptide repeat protein [Solirubrobacterales bacterium]